MSLVTVALATLPSLKRLVPVGEVFKKFKVPAVPAQTILMPCNRDLPSKIEAAAELFIPADTFPAGSPTAAIAVTVKKYFRDLLDMPVKFSFNRFRQGNPRLCC